MNQYQKFAVKLAQEAGKILLRSWRKSDKGRIKHHRELVTKTDIQANKYLVQAIKKQFPDHGIISEEAKPRRAKKDYVWIVDPLDGTTNFTMGFPFFSVALGLACKNEIILGIIYNPVLNDLYTAQKNRGAYLNKKRIRVSGVKDLKKSEIIFCHGTGKNDFAYDRTYYSRVQPKIRACRMWGAAGEEFGAVARGGAEAFIFTSSTSGIWDFAPGILIVREAGGKVTDLKEKDWYVGIRPHKNAILASNTLVHNKLLELIQNK